MHPNKSKLMGQPLNAMEYCILMDLCLGKSSPQIGKERNYTIGGVKTIIARIHGKLGAKNTYQAIAIALLSQRVDKRTLVAEYRRMRNQ